MAEQQASEALGGQEQQITPSEQGVEAQDISNMQFRTEITNNDPEPEETTPEQAQTEEVAQEKPGQSVEDESSKNNDWIKERLKRQERTLRREYEESLRAMGRTFQDMYSSALTKQQPTTPQMPIPNYNGNYTYQPEITMPQYPAQSPEQVVKEAVKKVLDEEKLVSKQQRFTQQENEMRNKYEDYDDIVREAGPHLSRNVLEAFIDEPEAIESFYKAWKEDPGQIKKAQDLTPTGQAVLIGKIHAKYSDKAKTPPTQDPSRLKSQANKPLTPVGTTGKQASVDPLDVNFASMAEKMIANMSSRRKR